MLADLPFELLTHIASYFDEAQQFHRLSLTSSRLHRFVESSGWRLFVQECFPSIKTPPFWREASHALSTRSRNLDRRSIVARHIQPSGRMLKWPGGSEGTRWQRPSGQRMGFRPAIDSFEIWSGDSWTSRTEILAFSAGAELVLRVKKSGSEALSRWQNASENTRKYDFDHHRDVIEWITYKPPGARQGPDDITCVKLQDKYRPSLQGRKPMQTVLIGTANGNLEALQMPLRRSNDATNLTSIHFQTGARSIESMDSMENGSPLLAVCLAGRSVAVYPLRIPFDAAASREDILPLSEVETTPSGVPKLHQLTWTVRFLNPSRLAVGIGPSETSLKVYEISGGGLTDAPLRQFSCPSSSLSEGNLSSRFNATSAYQIVPLPDSHGSREQAGDIFLCGFHDGTITAHDMRSPLNHVQMYQDPIDHSAIFSLQAIGRESVVAGGARHSTLKFFDLRMSGGRAYYHQQRIPMIRPKPGSVHQDVKGQPKRRSPHGWSLFLVPRDEQQLNRHHSTLRYPGTERGRHASFFRASPVYSLSMPSPCSPSIFAGTENQIVQLDLASMMDPHPDPVFESHIVRRQSIGDIHVGKTWDAAGDVLNLAMYDHTDAGAVDLMTQTNAQGVLHSEYWVEGYDERWRRGEKWKK